MAKDDLHHASSGFSFPFLDGMRGIAILSVVIFHLPNSLIGGLLGKIITGYLFAGSMGVSIFFVISGFLITLAVFAIKTKKDFYRYLVRRAGKILPPFYLILVLFGVMYLFMGHPITEILLAIVSYVTTYAHFDPTSLWFDPPCWTLFIEMHFYLVLPLVYLLLRRFTGHAAILTVLVFFLVPAVVRWATHYPEDQGFPAWAPIYREFPRTFDCFAFGMLYAVIFEKYRSNESLKKLAVPLSYLGFVLLFLSYTLAVFLWSRHADMVTFPMTVADAEIERYFTGTATFFLMFMTFYARGTLISLFTFAPLRYCGVVSYEWYLVHFPIISIFNHYRSTEGHIWVGLLVRLLAFSVSLGLASAMYHFFSEPILQAVKGYAKKIR